MSNTFKGTLGTWLLKDRMAIESCQGFSIADVYWNTEPYHTTMSPKEQGPANAILIAHAPEMLEMLEELVYIFKNESMSFEQQQQIEKAEDLITRATTI